MLVASYLFYGFWDYRFLFLVLLSTYIDFIGGLGVAGVRVPLRKMLRLTALLVGSALLLCTEIRYEILIRGLWHRSSTQIWSVLPQDWSHLLVPAVTLVLAWGYVAIQPWLFAQSPRYSATGVSGDQSHGQSWDSGIFQVLRFLHRKLSRPDGGHRLGQCQLTTVGDSAPRRDLVLHVSVDELRD